MKAAMFPIGRLHGRTQMQAADEAAMEHAGELDVADKVPPGR
jgi:hypothetical protein